MTQLEFMIECGLVNIDPSMALECKEIVEALQKRDDKAVIKALLESF